MSSPFANPPQPTFLPEPWKGLARLLLTLLLGALGGATTVQFVGCGKSTPPSVPSPPTQPAPPAPDNKPDQKPQPRPEPLAAICKVIMRGGYCSGTVVGPRRADGRWNVVSAAHCVKSHGEQVQLMMRDGRTLSAVVSAIDRRSDCAIFVTDPYEDLPFAVLATSTPPIGTRIWHAGFGFDKPANREDGTVTALPDANGQTRYRLNVSSGDSGGGIMMDDQGMLLSPVCCTTRIAGVGDVWGASPEVVARILANPTSFLDIPAVEMPTRPEPADAPKVMPGK